MLAYVLDRHGHPLMPCKPRRARTLLASGKARVTRRSPFTIRLLNGSTGYRQHVTAGPMQGFYNVKAYVLQRDGYRCQSGQKEPHVDALHVHHIVFRSKGGTDEPGNLITLCARCHDALHAGTFEISGKRSRTKHATEMGIIKSALKRSDWRFNETFGYVTKHHREQVLGLAKSHVNDAVAICCDPGMRLAPSTSTFYKRHVACGDYQQTKGVRSQMRIPTGKLFGLRKFDCVETPKGTGFVKGKRSSGQFALTDIHGTTLTASVNVKRNTRRRTARTSTLTMEEREKG